MSYSHALRTGVGLLSLAFSACTTAPPDPLTADHPASIHAPAAPLEVQPSAVAAYRDFGASAPAQADAPPVDHSMHERHGEGGPGPAQDDPERAHANH